MRRTPLRRTGALERRKPLTRPIPHADPPAAGEGTHGLPWADVRVIVYRRSGGRCEGCGHPIPGAWMEAHHRQTRAVGPDCPGNTLALCAECHHGPTGHGGPAAARALGRIVSRHNPDPCRVPVVIHGRGLVTLSCDGTVTEVTAPTRTAPTTVVPSRTATPGAGDAED